MFRSENYTSLTRRDFLRAGAAGAAGLSLGGLHAAERTKDASMHPSLPRRRAFPASADTTGPQARCTRRRSRAVPADQDQRPRSRNLRSTRPPHGAGMADHYAVVRIRPPPERALIRDRLPDDADRPAVLQRHRLPALRLGDVLPGRPEAGRPAAVRGAADAHRLHRRQQSATARNGRLAPATNHARAARRSRPATMAGVETEGLRSATAATPSASRACWPGGWSRAAYGFVTVNMFETVFNEDPWDCPRRRRLAVAPTWTTIREHVPDVRPGLVGNCWRT